MNRTLALGLLLFASVVCGIALWPGAIAEAAAAARSASLPDAAPLAAGRSLAGVEGDLARLVLSLLTDEQRARAIVAPQVAAPVMLSRSVPAGAVAVGGGVPVADLGELPRQLLALLWQHAHAGTPGAERLDPGLYFAWAGERRAGAPFYVRLHGADCVAEWVALADGVVHFARRDFGRDAGAPWLRERVFGAAGR